jgi:hypothetical protein
MRYLGQVLGFVLIFLVFIAGCTTNSVKESVIPQSIVVPSTISQSHSVAATVSQQGNNIVITYQGGPDAPMISGLHYGIGTADHEWNSPKIGDSVTLSGGTSGKDHVLVLATFTDGVHQVMLDTYI